MRKVLWLITGFLFCIFLIGIGGIVFTSYLPKIVQSRLLPEIQKKTEMSGISLTIRKLDLFGIDVADVQIGEDHKQGLEIDTVKIDFSPQTLVQKKIKSLTINGLDLHCRYSNGQFSIPGLFPFPQSRSPQPNRHASVDPDEKTETAVPVQALLHSGLETIKLVNVMLFVTYEQTTCQLPMEATLHLSKDTPGRIACLAGFFPYGQRIRVEATVNVEENRVYFNLSAKDLLLDAFATLTTMVPDLAISGHAELTAQAAFDLGSYKLSNAAADMNFRNFKLGMKDMVLANAKAGENSRPVRLRISGKDPHQWTVALAAASFALPSPKPVSIDIRDMTADIHFVEDKISTKGRLTAVLDDTARAFNLIKQQEAGIRLDAAFEGGVDQNRKWRIDIKTLPAETNGSDLWDFAAYGFNAQTKMPMIQLSGQGVGPAGKINTTVVLAGIKAQKDEMIIGVSKMQLNIAGFFEEGPIASEAEASLTETRVKSPSFSATLPRIAVKGTSNDLLAGSPGFKGHAAFSKASVAVDAQKITAGGISASLPLSWPCETPGQQGKLDIDSIQWDKQEIGSIQSRIRQDGLGIIVDGTHQDRLISGLTFHFSGKGQYGEKGTTAAVNFEMEPHAIYDPLDLGRLSPAARGTTFAGKLNLSGNAAFDGHQTQCKVAAGIKSGKLVKEEQSIEINGIDTDIVFPDIFQFKTAPKQQLGFKTAGMGNILFENGHVDFQVESSESLLIERSMFDWCSGHVETNSLRIKTSKDEYDLVLYCDRLNLAEILLQFSAADAEGNGTVSGRIPLQYEKGRWIFTDGFLYSAPGLGSNIKIKNVEKYASAIPEKMPQYDKFQMAQESIKNLNYKWAKVGFRTDKDNLLLELNFNGQPAVPIPFVYQQASQKFIRVSVEETQGIQPEFFMNFNFKLPFNELFQYREILDMIE